MHRTTRRSARLATATAPHAGARTAPATAPRHAPAGRGGGALSSTVAALLAFGAPAPLFAQAVAPASAPAPAASPATSATSPAASPAGETRSTDAGADAPRGRSLGTVHVRDHREPGAGNGYQGGATRIGKTRQLPKDVPQSLTLIPDELVRDQAGTTLKDALRNASGLTINAGEGGRIGDNINLRGFYSFGDLYLDGVRDVAQYNREVFNVDRVEVLRGASSMLFGRGTGGVINQVSKQAGLYERNIAALSLGTDSHRRLTADVNQRIGENAAIRLNVMKTDTGSTRDHVESHREGFAPTVRWGIGTRDEFELSHYQLYTKNTPDYGVPFVQGAPLQVPGNRFYGTTSDYEINDTRMTTATWTRRFAPETELRTTYRHAGYARDLWAVAPRIGTVGAAGVTDATVINRGRQARGGEERTDTLQSDLAHRFEAAGMQHEVLAGVELLRENAGRWNYTTDASAVAPSTTVGAPDASPLLPVGYGNRTRTGINTYAGSTVGLYLQDVVTFAPGWKVLAGLRNDQLKASYSNGAQVDYSELSYRAGLLHQPDLETTYYLSYGDAFSPTADLYQFTSAGTVYPAERTRTVELGGKWEVVEGALSLRAAIYRSEKVWERNTDVESAQTATILSKKRHTDGIELEAAGRITARWQVFGGVALMRSLIDEQAPDRNPNYVGLRPRNAPPYTFNLWTTYQLDHGWRIGGGLEAKGYRQAFGLGSTGTETIVPNRVPSYVRADAMVAWARGDVSVQVNFLNLTNKLYYDALYENGGHAVPGIGRTVIATVGFRF